MNCRTCGGGYGFLSGHDGQCNNCHTKDAERRTQEREERNLAVSLGITVAQLRKDSKTTPESVAAEKRNLELEADRLAAFILTTETAHNLPVTERLGIVTAEAVLGMNALKDIMSDVRGLVGGRSQTLQKGLRDAREICLTELKRDAIKLGADAVVGIDLDYQDIGGTGKMLMVVASGTAVKLKQ